MKKVIVVLNVLDVDGLGGDGREWIGEKNGGGGGGSLMTLVGIGVGNERWALEC